MDKKTKRYRIALTVLSILCVMYLILALFCLFCGDTKIENTTECNAVVSMVAGKENASNGYRVYTNEYHNYFIVSGDIAQAFTPEDLSNFTEGANITFRVKHSIVNGQKGEATPIIVSLKIDGRDIFTLQEYNSVSNKRMKASGLRVLCIFAVFGAAEIITAIKYKSLLKHRQLQIQKTA